jgi:protein-disulfide isomerase
MPFTFPANHYTTYLITNNHQVIIMLKNLIVFILAIAVSTGVYAAESKSSAESKPAVAAPKKAAQEKAAPAKKTEAKDAPVAAEPTADQLLEILPNDIVIGDIKAPVTIVEYASMSCTHCAAFHNSTFSDLKEKYIDTGKVRFVFRDFPLDEPALRGAMMARCAGKGDPEKFLKFTKVMFSTQSNWAPKKNYLEVLANIGKLGGMKGEEFDACMADKSVEDAVMLSKFNAAKQLEVRSTPTFFINKEEHKGGRDLKYFSEVIDGILSGNPKPAAADKPKEAK